MRLWRFFLVFGLCAAVLPVFAQIADSSTSSNDVTVVSLLNVIPFGPLIAVFVLFGVLFKVFAQRPKHERWLVAASLLLLPPVATFMMRWHVYLTAFSPVRDTGLFWSAVALLLGVVWWVLKYQTSYLKTPDASLAPDRAARVEAPTPEPQPTHREAPAPAPSPQPQPARPTASHNDAIFISYRRQDSADATGRIYDRLIQHFGREQVFKDVDSIPLGVDFREHLGNVVGRCTTLIAVIGPQWATVAGANGRRLDDKSDFVRVEIEAALARNIPVIPVLVGGAMLPADTELPPSIGAITYRNGISVRPDPDFHRDMDRLIAGLMQHGRG